MRPRRHVRSSHRRAGRILRGKLRARRSDLWGRRVMVPAAHYRPRPREGRSEEHTSELQSLMRISYAVFCLKKKTKETKLSRYLLTITPSMHTRTSISYSKT